MLLPYVACDAKKEFPGLTADRPGIFILGNTTNEYRWQWAEDAMIITIIRTMILFLLVVLVVRLMGKRQVGELQPYELAVTVMISNLAAVPMEDTGIPLFYGIIPILLVFSFQVGLSVLSLKSIKAREIICGRPSVVVENGKIIQSELSRLKLNLNDLLEQLRINGYANIEDVEFAIFETNGQFSIIPKADKRPVTLKDMGLTAPYEGLSYTLVIDGQINKRNLEKTGRSEEWLRNEIRKAGFDSPRDLIIAILNPTGEFYCQPKKGSGKELRKEPRKR